MNLELSLVLELLAGGLCVGLLAGLLGIGGGLMLVPLMAWVLGQRNSGSDHVLHVAIATSLAVILLTSISSVYAHHQRGALRWPIALQFTPGILLGSWVGSWISSNLPTRTLLMVFCVFVLFSAYQMLLNKKPKPSRSLPPTAGMLGVGGVIGLLAGMMGTGGAFIAVPFLTWCNVASQSAVATSAAIGLPIAIAGALGYIYHGWGVDTGIAHTLGFVYWPAVLVISTASVIAAPVGAKLAYKLSGPQLKKAFACLLIVLGCSMGAKALGYW
jgi:uncharacterized protein